jgi:MFS family permease
MPSPEIESTPPLSDALLHGFMLLGVLVGTSNGIAKVCLPLYAAALHASPWQIGLVGGLQFGGMLLLSLPLGALIDRHGSRSLFRLGASALAALYLLGLTQVREPWQLILCVVLLGTFNPFRIVPTQTEFLHILPRLGPGKAGWNRASHTMGMFFIGPSLGAALLGWIGFRPTFVVVAAGMLVSLAVGNYVLRDAEPGRGDQAAALKARIRGQLRVVAERPHFRRTMGIEFCGQMAMSYFTVFIVLVGIRQFGMHTQEAAGLLTLQGALFVATLFGGGVLLARWGEEARYGLAFSLLFAHEVLMFAPQHKLQLSAAAGLLGIGLGTQHLTSVTRFGALMREYGRGRVGGLFSLAGPSGGLTGAVLGGLLGQHFGLLAGFRVLSAVYAVQLFLFVRGLREPLQDDALPVGLGPGGGDPESAE